MNSILFTNFLGNLDAGGTSTAQFNIPMPIPGLFYGPLYFAYTLVYPWDQVSNPVAVYLVE